MHIRVSLLATVLLSVALPTVFLSCTPGGPGPGASQTETTQLIDDLSRGDHRFLDTLDVSAALLDRLRAEDVGAPYALGRALEARGLDEAARRVFQAELESASNQWAGLSAVRLALLSQRHGNYLSAYGHAMRGTELLPAFRDGWYALGEALYERDEYRELLQMIERMPALSQLTLGESVSPTALGAERELWSAVAAWELGEDGARAMERATLAVSADPIHERLYLYLFYRTGQLASLPPETRVLMEAVYRHVRGEAAEATRQMRMVEPTALLDAVSVHFPGDGGDAGGSTDDRSASIQRSTAGIWDTLESLFGGDGTSATRAWLDRLRDAAEEDGASDVVARIDLVRAAGDPALRESILIETARGAPVAAFRATAIDRWVDHAVAVGRPLETAIDQLVALGADDAVYARTVDRLLPDQVRRRAWNEARAAWYRLPESAAAARDHLALVVLFAADAGYIASDPVLEARVAQAAVETSAIGSTGMLAKLRAGLPFISSVPAHGAVESSEIEEVTGTEVVSEVQLELADALLTAGLPSGALRLAMSTALRPENATAALLLARRFSELGHSSAALDLARRAVSRGEMAVTNDLVPLLYPLPFRPELEAAAGRFDVPVALLAALVREESHFRPIVSSPVGAQGLGQIMPGTADDIRRRMDWPGADVGRPGDNLLMSAFYLDYLAGQISSPVLRLAAYNAGLGRGRRWESEFGDLPLVLQIEALPFVETRWYLRRITASHAFYHFRYHGEDPADGLVRFLEGALW